MGFSETLIAYNHGRKGGQKPASHATRYGKRKAFEPRWCKSGELVAKRGGYPAGADGAKQPRKKNKVGGIGKKKMVMVDAKYEEAPSNGAHPDSLVGRDAWSVGPAADDKFLTTRAVVEASPWRHRWRLSEDACEIHRAGPIVGERTTRLRSRSMGISPTERKLLTAEMGGGRINFWGKWESGSLSLDSAEGHDRDEANGATC
ncbi:hypothetical protein BDN71DRAFT_1433865 [Pleurotus eryngii]|uniref:Uncharacterized protein n=1 Tax=Pleurotus eryngii TaxID=5323 RepID=A0A9P6DC98_PLEER|nr:hypothetical protein BDN71DRAFT_1433865 [Pleurotus eryngii]